MLSDCLCLWLVVAERKAAAMKASMDRIKKKELEFEEEVRDGRRKEAARCVFRRQILVDFR